MLSNSSAGYNGAQEVANDIVIFIVSSATLESDLYRVFSDTPGQAWCGGGILRQDFARGRCRWDGLRIT